MAFLDICVPCHMKTCSVCQKDSSPYKCPKCSLLYCSVACCKVHKEVCILSVSVSEPTAASAVVAGAVSEVAETGDKSLDSTAGENTISKSNTSTQQERILSSKPLQTFLSNNPYLLTQLPVLLARIDRPDSNNPNHNQSTNTNVSQFTRDFERTERIINVLGEAIDTDPQVLELFKILQDDNLI